MFLELWSPGRKYRFVFHKHKAEKAGLHYDLRIENNKGTLSSFAGRKLKSCFFDKFTRVAVFPQADHHISWLKFKGTWETGYGKGKFTVEDHGVVTVISVGENTICFDFVGKRKLVNGQFCLLRLRSDMYLFFRKNKISK